MKTTRSSSPGVSSLAAARGAALQKPAPAPPPKERPARCGTEQLTSWLALGSFSALLTLVLAEQWAVPPIVPSESPVAAGFSADRTREAQKLSGHDLATCGTKYVGCYNNEVCAVDAVTKQIAKSAKGQEKRLELDKQSASGHYYLDFIGGLTIAYRNLTNVVARVRGKGAQGASGSSSSCALLISSHFDSAIGSVASSDANAEIAIMTELLHLFLNDPLDVDVIFNFNGGEEFILPAAHGFVTSHPWAPEICAQINLESAGSGGRELFFQAGPRNRWVTEAYGQSVRRPYGSSITQVLFQLGIIPGETDYRVYRDFGGIPGADFAVLTNGWVYHTWRDDISHIDFRSIQRYGDTIYDFAHGLASKLRDGRPEGSDATDAAVFFDVGGKYFVEYSADLARKMHLALALIVLSTLPLRSGASATSIFKAALKLFAGFLASLLAGAITGAAVAFTPGALVGSGHPELAPLLFVPPTLAAFLGSLKLTGRDDLLIPEGSIALAALLCIGLSLSPVAVLAAYPFLFWSALPALAAFCPRPLRPVATTAAFVLPWLLHLQFLVLGLDLLCPLTFRSGTSIPGDVVIGAFYGLMTGLFLALSARVILPIPHWATKMLCLITFAMALGLALWLFPYSHDRPKRVFLQHVARSTATWTPEASGGKASAQWAPMESGIWTAAQDWNNVDTLQKFAPYGWPSGSKKHENSVGLYGQVPMPFPMRWLLLGGVWAPRPAPEIPVHLGVEVSSTPRSVAGEDLRDVQISIRGPQHMMLVLSPLSSLKAWSFGRYATKEDVSEAKHEVDPERLPKLLPHPRMDCDCLFLLFAEGGLDPTRGREEAFNFTVVAPPGELDMDIWGLHLETTTPELRHEEERVPSWVNFYAWTSELQVHKMML